MYEGKTFDEAVQKGLGALGLSRAEATITLIEEGKGGFLGFGARPYRVSIARRPGGAIHEPVEREGGRDRRPPRRGGRDERRGGGRDPRAASDRGPREERAPRDARPGRDERGGRDVRAGREDRPPRDDRGAREDRAPRDDRGPREARPGRDERRDARRAGRPQEAAPAADARPPREERRRDDRPPRPAPPDLRETRPEGDRPAPAPMMGDAFGSPEGGAEGESRRRRRRGRRGGRGRRRAEGDSPMIADAPFTGTNGGGGHAAPEPMEAEPMSWEQPSPPPVREETESYSAAPRMSAPPPAPAYHSPAPAPAAPSRYEETSAPAVSLDATELAETSRKLTEDLLKAMGFEAKVTVTTEDTRVDVTAEVNQDDELLTGRKGEVRQALQHLLNRFLNRGDTSHYHLQLEINDFWKRREDELRELAHTLAEQALAGNTEAVTEYLNSQERRIVHVTLKEDTRVKTYALGTGMIKRVAVAPADFPERTGEEEA